MQFWFELLRGAENIQFATRLLVHMVVIALVCMAIATEGALRSRSPAVRVIARVVPLVAVVCQGNMTRGMQSAIWWGNADRKVVDDALADEANIDTPKVSLNWAWSKYLPRRHGSSPPVQPFLQASVDCLLLSRDLMGGAPVTTVERNVQVRSLDFTVLGNNCTVKLDQIHSTLLQVQLSKPGDVREAQDGTTNIDVPTGGIVVHLGERSIWDLAKKWIFEETRRFP
jgi:hypothetical protein